VPRHGSGQQVQRSSAGSIPHDRTKILQICSSHPRPLHRPRQSASRHPPVVTNRPATDRVRRDPRLIQQPFHHPPACWSASTPFTHLIRGTQIPIAKPQHPRPPPAVSSLGGLRTPAPRAGRATVMGPPSANLHNSGRSLKVFTRGRARDGMLSRAKTPDTAAPMLAVALKLNQFRDIWRSPVRPERLAATLRSATAISQ
jgi:hypothetical protein